MRKCDIHTILDAFAYYTDCQLATVAGMAMKKRRPKWEYKRQIAIAQGMVEWFKAGEIFDPENRANLVLLSGDPVEVWAKQFEPRASQVDQEGKGL